MDGDPLRWKDIYLKQPPSPGHSEMKQCRWRCSRSSISRLHPERLSPLIYSNLFPYFFKGWTVILFLAREMGLNVVSLQRINNSAVFHAHASDWCAVSQRGKHFLSAPINNHRSAPNRFGQEEAGAQHVGFHQNFWWLQYVVGPNGGRDLARIPWHAASMRTWRSSFAFIQLVGAQ